jgi:hypothetical protein
MLVDWVPPHRAGGAITMWPRAFARILAIHVPRAVRRYNHRTVLSSQP